MDRPARLSPLQRHSHWLSLGQLPSWRSLRPTLLQPCDPAVVRVHAQVMLRTIVVYRWQHCCACGSAQTMSFNNPAENLGWHLRAHDGCDKTREIHAAMPGRRDSQRPNKSNVSRHTAEKRVRDRNKTRAARQSNSATTTTCTQTENTVSHVLGAM